MNKIVLKDRTALNRDEVLMPSLQPGGLWAKTEVIGGYGDVNINPNGKSSLGEEIFRTHNIVPIGGVSYIMQQAFEIPETQISIPTLYDQTGIGLANSTPPSEKFVSPDRDNWYRSVMYRYGHCVQLFGVGITATAENDISIYKPDYRENSIKLSKVTTDRLTVTGTMLPFRYTTEQLSRTERRQYFGKKKDEYGFTGYYLKKFNQDPVIKHTWKTGEDYEDEVLVSSSEVWTNTSGINAVESFTEIFLKIGKKDIKEWFNIRLEQPDRTRINTIALFDGQFVKDINNQADDGDYRDVRMFSKLVINPEYLNLNKDLNIIYRVYGA
jgi:hypothetical protein